MKQIIAMGGGGFSMEPDNLALDRYILKQTENKHPKVCFVPTASGDAESYLLKFYQACGELDCRPTHLSLFRLPTADLEGFVLEQDIIYVGGGNTRSMLALWREWGLDAIFRKAYEAGIILAGISAGANCWFEQSTTDSVPGGLQVLAGLGLLKGSFTPHYDGEQERRPSLHRLLKDDKIQAGFAVDNSAALHFVDGQLLCGVCSVSTAKAYWVSCKDRQVIEETLEIKDISIK